MKRIQWEKPPVGWMKFNTDSSACGNPSVAGCQGVIRNDHGHWIAGFTRRIGATNSFIAELWGSKGGPYVVLQF